MGVYREAVADSGPGTPPDITLHRHPGSVSDAFGSNLQQELSHDVRLFARVGWSGKANTESFAYTEANSTIAGGADVRYLRNFKTGFAAATGGISADHKAYSGGRWRGVPVGMGDFATRAKRSWNRTRPTIFPWVFLPASIYSSSPTQATTATA